MGKTIKKCKAKNPPLSLYLSSVLPCLAYTCRLPCPVLPIPVVRSCVSLGSSVFCLYWSVPSISAYLWSLCLVGFRRVSLLLFVVAVPCVCLCLWGVLPLCSLWCFVWVFLYGGCCLCRGFSLVVVGRSGRGSVWCCRWSCRGLPCGRLGVWWFALLWFMLVVSGGGALGAAGRCGRSFWSLWCWGCLIGVWGSLARSLGISQLPACLVSEFLLRFSIKPRQHVAYFGFC